MPVCERVIYSSVQGFGQGFGFKSTYFGLGLKFQVHDVLEESLAALAVLAELDEVAMGSMTTAEFVAVVTRYLCQGRKEAQENACLLLEKLSLEEGLKETIGASPGVMETLKHMLADEKNPKPIKLATKTLLALCLLRDNRLRYACFLFLDVHIPANHQS